jgi:hypothetical protein
MTIEELRAFLKSRPELLNLSPNVEKIATLLSPVVRLKENFVTERGIVNALDIEEGEVFLESLEAFVVADLPAQHPLKRYQKGIKRQVAWLQKDGLDAGSPRTRAMLDVMALVGILNTESVQKIKQLGEENIIISPEQVRQALFDQGGIPK